MKTTRRVLAATLSFLSVAFAPGLTPYQAAAQVMGGAASAGRSGAVPVIARLEVGVGLGLSPAASPAPSLTPGPSFSAPVAAPYAEIPILPVSTLEAGPIAAVGEAPAPVDAKTQLVSVGEKLSAADGPGRPGILESLFTGARDFGSPLAVPPAVPSPFASAPTAAASAEGRATPPTPISLEKLAIDPASPLAQRKDAVAELAKGSAPQESLERVAAANAEGGAADYEVHRAALRALAERGIVKSLRPVSTAHKDEILAKLAADKPASAVFDYDDTLAKFREPISPDVAAALKAAADAGVETAILSDRPDAKHSEKDVTILDSIAGMSAAQKAKLTVGSNSGARLAVFDRTGAPVTAFDAKLSFSSVERDAIVAASALTAGKFGRYEYNGKEENLADFKWVRFLPPGTPAETVQEAARFMQAELASRGVEIAVSGRQAADLKNPSYLSISKLDKSVGVSALRGSRALRERLQDAVRFGFSGRLLEGFRGLASKLKGKPTPSESMLLVGDSFFGTRTVDGDMSKAAPGALTLAVGGSADPRLDNAFVWPTKGAEASLEILGALGRPSAGAIDKKVAFGLFFQRSVSILAFIGVSIAYPLAVVPVVGWAGYGVLMAFGPLAGIAAGPIAGRIIDTMSARGAMTLNTVLRGALLLALPAFHLFGILNFWTLLIASIANGWLLVSIMTTEGAFLPRLFAAKRIGTINSLLFVNYLFLQVLGGLILGFGQIVDKWNPFNVFTGASLLNFALVLVVLKTFPNVRPQAVVRASEQAAQPKVPFLKKYWKESLLLSAAVAGYALLHSPLPIIAAIVYWITRTEGFRQLWSGRAAKPMSDGSEQPARLRHSMLLLALGSMMIYALQYVGLPQIAEVLVGKEHQGLLLGEFLGALFFGNMISAAAQARLPEMRVPFLGRFSGQRLIQAAVLALAGTWVFTKLVPGGGLAAAAAVAIAAGLMYGAQKLTARGWVKFVGVGFSAVWLPFLAWTGVLPFLSVTTAMMIGLIAIGMSYGPSFVALISYFMGNTRESVMGKTLGVQSSFFNASISIGCALLTLGAGLFHPAFPALLAVLGIAYLIGGAVFWRAPKGLPGLPQDLLRKRSD